MKMQRISGFITSMHPGSACTSSRHAYDVFLNFRGDDTRDNFVDCLYEFLTDAGIRVFMDDEALHIGDEIRDELLKAMGASSIYIPIFSRNYASSKWCLIELDWMVDDCLRKSDGKEILPVFFDVEPEDVKLQTELYTEDLLRHEERFGSQAAWKWREALRKVSGMKGWNKRSNQGQGKLIRQITRHISHRIDHKHRNLPDHYIGIEERVLDIMQTLELGTRDLRMVVIHGMGGIGKTTLASDIFNKIRWEFQGCSFLSNVRELATGSGIIKLQNKLLNDILRFSLSNFVDENDAMNCLQGSLRNKNVLVVLDDVSDMNQVKKLTGMGDWFGLGSRVIITTRNMNCIAYTEEIENNITILQGKKFYIYQMRELSFDDALELLTMLAFGSSSPPFGYEQILHDILSFTGGVPLALEVIGSCLKGKNLKKWKEMSNKLKKVPHDRLYQKILMSSYEMLSNEEKEVFLDIEFFFVGHDKMSAFYYWDACGLFPEVSVDELISSALVKIDGSNSFWMHDLLKDLGREVVRKQSTENLGRRSRLCDEDAKRLLLQKEGTECVRALKLNSTHAHNFSPADLSGLSGLRYLELSGGNFVGKFDDGRLSGLRWLSWQDCPRDFHGTNFCFENLVVLRISRSIITDTWTGWKQFQSARNLKVLELEDLELLTTLDLGSFLSLERLVVHQFGSLICIDPWIGNLECLDSLEIINRRWSPDEIIPDESCQEAVHLPNSVCNLKALSRLVIRGFKLNQLPENIGELKGLKNMEITCCEMLRNLPDSIGDLESLCKLRLEGNGILELPDSIGKLRNLTELDISYNRLRRLPPTIGGLDRLEVLDACANGDLAGEIPVEFCSLRSLKSLDLSLTGICSLPSMVQLSCLESLILGDCHEIQELSNLPTSLTNLQISSRSLKAVPDLSRQTNLVNLKLSNRGYHLYDQDGCPLDDPQVLAGNITSWIHHLQKLQSLTVDLSPMPQYLSTGLDPFSQLRYLQISCPNPSLVSLPSGLEYLSLDHSTSLSHWEHHSNLEGLSTLSIHKSVASEIWLDGLESLKNLIRLEVRGCEFLERVKDISMLQKLQVLHLSECPKLAEIGGLAKPPGSLQRLEIWRCDSIVCLPDPSDSKSPRELHLEVIDCSKLLDFDGPYDSYFQRGKEH